MEPEQATASKIPLSALLGGSQTLAPAERELIAVHVSSIVRCVFCVATHSAIAAHHLGGETEIILRIQDDFRKAPIPERLKALLSLAGKVRSNRQHITHHDLDRARRKGVSDLEIRDTLLIASMFCMCNGKGWHKSTMQNGRYHATAKPTRARKTKRAQTGTHPQPQHG